MANTKFESNRHRILRVQLYIENHLDHELPLKRLAEVAQLSQYHFHRIFRATVGEGVAEYVRRVRLEAAAIALKASNESVTNLAFDVGYGSHEAFTRAFRRKFGVSPSDFRSNHVNYIQQRNSDMNSQTTNREINISEQPSLRVAFLRHTGPYQESGSTFQKLMGWAFSKNLFGPQTKLLGICHDDPDVTPAEKIRFDCCISVDDGFTPDGEFEVQTIPEGEYVILKHFGSYSNLPDSYSWLYGEWLSTSGREFANCPPFEVYVNNPNDTPEKDLITEIHIMLQPK